DVKIDESQFTYGPKQSKPSESDARSGDFNSCECNSSEETLKTMPEPVVNEPKVAHDWKQGHILLNIKTIMMAMLLLESSKAKNEGEKPNKSNEKPVDQENQAFLEELERLKSQEKEVNDAAEALRKEFAQDTKDLLLQAGATRASSTNIVNTASTP
ncbi:hypothetical protein Tco_0230613, partial [Tanacetum coccineum]